jgi:hypothetical protein
VGYCGGTEPTIANDVPEELVRVLNVSNNPVKLLLTLINADLRLSPSRALAPDPVLII